MAWSTIRKATDADLDKVRIAAYSFCVRHDIDFDGMDPETAINCELDNPRLRPYSLKPLWRRILKRITGSADGIAYGYIGHHVED